MKIIDNLSNITTNNLFIKEGQPYALIIGETPSKGARSPKLWNRVYKNLKKNVKMYPADVKLNDLTKLISFLKKDKFFLGAAITTPYKEKILRYLDKYPDEVKQIGSINTIKKKNKSLLGFNTDYFGTIEVLKKYKNKKKILILGVGGAGKSTIMACIKKFKNSFFYFYNRDKKKLVKFIKNKKVKKYKILNYSELLKLKNLDLVVNTTSIGFNSWIKRKKYFYNLVYFTPLQNLNSAKGLKKIKKEDFIKINKKLINEDTKNCSNFFLNNKKCEVFDIIYNPKSTKLLRLAKKKGHETQNGLAMNLYQAIKGFSIVNNINHEYKIKKIMEYNG